MNFAIDNYITGDEVKDFTPLNPIRDIEDFTTVPYVKYVDHLSYEHYKTHDLWWAIAYYNNIVDPFSIKEADSIRIPDFNTLKDTLHKIATDLGREI